MKTKFIYPLAVFIVLLDLSELKAREYKYLGRSPRALFMGDAYTAIADDAFTLFYNPAALGRHDGLSLHIVNPQVSAINALGEMDRFKNFPSSDPVAMSDRLIGLPIHLGFSGRPTIKLQHLGMTYFADFTTNLELKNAVHPIFDLDLKYDRGFIIGYAFSFGNGGNSGANWSGKKKSKKANAGQRISVGTAIKSMSRQGILQAYDLFGLKLLNKIQTSGSDFSALKNSLGYSNGSGIGVDAGAEILYAWSSSQLIFATSILDIGDTKFPLSSGTTKLPAQLMSWNSGVSWRQDFTIIDYTLSFDLHPINQPLPMMRKVHFGARVGIPFVDVMFGWNGGYISYGLGLDLFLVSLYAGFYNVEIGSRFLQHKSQRVLFSLNLIDFTFEP